MKITWLIFLISYFPSAKSNVELEQEKRAELEYSKLIRQKLEEIKELAPEEYFHKIDQYRTQFEKYASHKKQVCKGVFSTIILDKNGKIKESGKAAQNSYKLSKKEQSLCFQELNSLQISFVNNMFQSRKRYLNHLHQKRLQGLQEARDSAIKQLKKSKL